MDDDGDDLVADGIVATLLAGTSRAFYHRIHHLEVGRIEGEHHVHVAAGRADVRREALVVLHVARALQVGQVVVALEFVEQLGRGFTERIHQHVQAPTMRHGDNHFVDTLHTALLDEVVDERDKRIAAF